jgi:hypothetical protein
LFAWQETEIRGKQETLAIAVLASGRDLPGHVATEQPAPRPLTPAAASLRSQP